ncbi:hypothetical protein [Brachyspira pilosicoli]|uniref:hypothetical protein n=1 Tax=Brachyspira pilosicoli TaxID=52584 RepID=UPI0013153B5B|nr:hypothetical protein [Brachyspira pilosicoli]
MTKSAPRPKEVPATVGSPSGRPKEVPLGMGASCGKKNNKKLTNLKIFSIYSLKL